MPQTRDGRWTDSWMDGKTDDYTVPAKHIQRYNRLTIHVKLSYMYLLSQQLFGRLQGLLHHLNESFITGGVAFHLHDKSIPTQPLTRNILSSLIRNHHDLHKTWCKFQ